MYTCQCKGCQIGQSSGVLLEAAAALWRCPLIEVHCTVYSAKYVCTVKSYLW